MRILHRNSFFRHLTVSWSLPVAKIILLRRCYAFIVYGTLILYFHFFYTLGQVSKKIALFSFPLSFALGF